MQQIAAPGGRLSVWRRRTFHGAAEPAVKPAALFAGRFMFSGIRVPAWRRMLFLYFARQGFARRCHQRIEVLMPCRSVKPWGAGRRVGKSAALREIEAESPEGAGGERGLVADSPTRPEGGARPAPSGRTYK
ncbi:MAG: hypothetical protein LBU37_13905 [Tannerellaceae bacterium]|nr:hypothetical protein [Tannerellaceae bacterium]